MIVFKRASNPCLIGRDVLSIHPATQEHFLAMMGLKKPKSPSTSQTNDSDHKEEMPLECKNVENKNRASCKTKRESLIERECITRASIESFYDCKRDHHHCNRNTSNQHQINSIDYPGTPANTPTEIILIRALDIHLEETNKALDESIAEHENPNVSQTPTSKRPIPHSGLTSALRDKLALDFKRKRIHRTKSPSGRRPNASQSSTSSAHNNLTSSILDKAEPEDVFNYSGSTQDISKSEIMSSYNISQEPHDSKAEHTGTPILNESAVKQEPGTRREPQGELMEEPNAQSQEDQVDRLNLSSIRNLGLINDKSTEILEEEDVDRAHNRDEVKKEIFDMLKRNRSKTITEIADECIRINRRTYAPVEVNKDRNGRTLFAPILPNAKLDISFGAETRSLNTTDSEERSSKPIEDELIEVEYPRVQRRQINANAPDIKIKVNVEIIQPKSRDNRNNQKSYQIFKFCLTRDELVKLITDEIKLKDDKLINLVDIIDQSVLTETNEALQAQDNAVEQ